MKIKAFLPCYSDYKRQEFLLSNFTKYNPDIEIFSVVFSNASPEHIFEKYNIKKFKKYDRDLKETFINQFNMKQEIIGYYLFEKFFDYGLNEENYDYILYLETDVLCRKKIKILPQYDVNGVLGFSAPHDNILAEQVYELKKYDMLRHNNMWLQTGCGGSIFSRNYFLKSSSNLNKIKEVSEKYPSLSANDMCHTILATISGCTYGGWEDATQKNSFLPYDAHAALEHNVKI